MKSNINDFSKDFLTNFATNRKYRSLHHFSLLLFVLGFTLTDPKRHFTGNWDTVVNFIVFNYFAGIIYLNMYVLVPKILFRERTVLYLLTITGIALGTYFFFIVVVYSILRPYELVHIPLSISDMLVNLLRFCFLFTAFFGPSTFFKLLQQWIKDTNRIHELEKATIESELEQLKKQVNPHFLFNTLNNVNVLTQTDPKKASQVLTRLSDLIRYQLYDSAKEQIFLNTDIHFLTDYLNLEKIRRDNFEFTISTKGEISNQLISPLLFIPFVENAVKYSLDSETKSYIYLSFEIEKNILYFVCINSKPTKRIVPRKESGLGLNNVRRRLELLYDEKFSLDVKEDDSTYQVNLCLILKK
jgi:Putative regulator of cell autolysis